jgi:hypothetical protein
MLEREGKINGGVHGFGRKWIISGAIATYARRDSGKCAFRVQV